MSTGLIIAIVVVALLLLGLLVLLPRMRANARERAREREIGRRRQEAAEQHRGEAERRELEASRLESEARARRAQAEVHGEHASMHERGMADDALVGEGEDDLAQHVEERTGGRLVTDSGGGTRAVGDDASDYDRGRRDQREADEGGRFARTPEDDRVSEERRFARSDSDAATPDRPAAVRDERGQ